MKISTLREFLYLSEELNFSNTARHFYINQSALSRHIASLEEEVGCKLFLRNKQSVKLTEAGKLLTERAKKLVDDHDAILRDIARMQHETNSQLSIGYLQGAAGQLLDIAFKLFRRERPDTTLVARSMQPNQILTKLKNDEIDIGITMHAPNKESSLLAAHTLYKDEFVLMMHATHPLASREAVRVRDITEPVLIPEEFPHDEGLNSFLLAQFDASSIPYKFSGVVDDMESMPLLLTNTRSITVSCKHLSNLFGSRFKHVPIADVDLEYEISVMWKNARESQAILDFANCLDYAMELSQVGNA